MLTINQIIVLNAYHNIMSFLSKIKSAFKPKQPIYKHYSPSDLKVLAMRTRVILQEIMKKSKKNIRECDGQLSERKQMSSQKYKVMQQIGRNVIQVECIKIYIQILRKIEDKAALIIKTNGDIALLKTQIQWFQSILWYRKSKKLTNLDQLWNFCYNFFKGVDVTMEINVKCQIFKIFDILKYLDPKCILPLKKLFPQIQPYINSQIDEEVLNQIFRINKDDIRLWFKRQKVQIQEFYFSKSKSKSPHKYSPRKQEQNQNNPMSQSAVNPSYVRKKQSLEADLELYDRQKNLQLQKQEASNISDQSSFKTTFLRKMKSQNNNTNTSQSCTFDIDEELHREANKEKYAKTQQYQVIKQDNQSDQEKYSFQREANRQNSKKQMKKKNDIFPSFGENDQNDEILTPTNTQKKEDQNCQIQQYQQGENSERYQKNEEIRLNFQSISKKPEKYEQTMIKKENSKQKSKEYRQSHYNDEGESISFLRQCIKQTKKVIKKPYMVSIYARAQFVNKK